MPSADPKPLPVGTHRLVCACICGRRVRERDLVELITLPPCRDCGSTVRVWMKYRVSWFARLSAWWQLYRWKKRRKRLYVAR